MAQTVSSIPEVVAQIRTLMTTALATAAQQNKPVKVTTGMPIDLQRFDQFVIGDITEGINNYTNMRAARKPREESYKIDIHVIVRRVGVEATAAQEAAMSHYSALTDAIADDPGIGLGASVSPTLRLGIGEFSMSSMADESTQGWVSHFRAKVLVYCRLT